jgi:hypothetical protein
MHFGVAGYEDGRWTELNQNPTLWQTSILAELNIPFLLKDFK